MASTGWTLSLIILSSIGSREIPVKKWLLSVSFILFSEAAPAYTILSENQRVWGGRSFDGHSDKNRRCMSAFFFLPQVELIRFDEGWRLAVNIGMSKEVSIRALKQLVADAKELAPLASDIVSLRHTPEKTQWCDLVDDVLAGIQQDKFKKVVLARKTCVDLKHSISPAQLLKASYAQNHHSFHFLMALSPGHAFVAQRLNASIEE